MLPDIMDANVWQSSLESLAKCSIAADIMETGHWGSEDSLYYLCV